MGDRCGCEGGGFADAAVEVVHGCSMLHCQGVDAGVQVFDLVCEFIYLVCET